MAPYRAPSPTAQTPRYDVVVVGGGPAGLSAALLLGRSRRSVLICDAGHPRNGGAISFNAYLSRDGSTPKDFRRICLGQLDRYPTVTRFKDTVKKVQTKPDGFAVQFAHHRPVVGRTILLASGLIDELPPIRGLARLYGKVVHSCPYCHGWECRGKRIGVVGSTRAAADLSVELGIWSSNVVLFTNGASTPAGQLKKLRLAGVEVVRTPVLRLSQTAGKQLAVHLRHAVSDSLAALFLSPRQHQRCPIAKALGCKFSKKDGGIECNDRAFTGIPGVYAAGNASKGIQLVVMAAAEGAAAAVAINEALLDQDLKKSKEAG